ncbi:MAG: O-antigen ligase family protein [Candidatus Marinimicrobia bacterium]|nr:O-antigen ligase family protein [Candidatus Neomarinimicrobiota bacterium]
MGKYTGISSKYIEKIIMYSMAIVSIIYFSIYMMMYIPALMPVVKTHLIDIIGIDQDRGIRIKGPMFVIVLSLYYYSKLLKKTENYKAYFLMWMLILCDIIILYLHQPRTLLSGGLLALIIVPMISQRRQKIKILAPIFLIVLIIGIFSGRHVMQNIGDRFEGNFSLSSRIFSAGIAWSSIQQHPVFGLGFASHQSVAYQSLFGESFYPDDIGLLGIIFQFGMLGGILYLYLLYWLAKNAVINLKNPDGWSDGLSKLWVFSTFMMITILPTIAKAVRDDGIGITALALGILLAGKISGKQVSG